jgi:hypothetical protein
LDEARDVLNDHDRIVDDETGGERDAEERQRVDREAEHLHQEERAEQRDRDRERRDERGAPILQEQEDHDDDQDDRHGQRDDDFLDRFAHEQRGVERDAVVDAGGKLFREAFERRDHVVRDLERVAGLQLLHAEADAVLAVEPERDRVVFRTEAHAADVVDADESTVRLRHEDDVAELGGAVKPPVRLNGVLVRLVAVGRRGADGARRDLHVLLLERGRDRPGGQIVVGQLLGIQPQPHRVLALAEDGHAAHARDALDIVDDVVLEIVGDERLVVILVVRRHADAHDERAVVLRDLHAGQRHGLRQMTLREIHRVLHVVGGLIEIAADVERAGDRRAALARRLRRHVTQTLNAVDGVFEDVRHARLDRERVGADVGRGDRDGRRRDVRVLRDRQRRNRDDPEQKNDERADRRKDGPPQEEVDHAGWDSGRSARVARRRSRRRCFPRRTRDAAVATGIPKRSPISLKRSPPTTCSATAGSAAISARIVPAPSRSSASSSADGTVGPANSGSSSAGRRFEAIVSALRVAMRYSHG